METNTVTLLSEFVDSLEKEISKKKEIAVNKPKILKNGKLSAEMPNGVIFRFDGFNGSAMPDSPAEIEIITNEVGNNNKYNALIISVENDVLSLYISAKDIPNPIESAKLFIDDTKILEGTKNTIIRIKEHNENSPRVLADKAFRISDISPNKERISNFPDDFNESQKNAVRLSIGSDVTYIWGPPGTGKSQTLGFIAELLLKDNRTLLITAHTNEAVDGLMEKIIKLFDEKAINEGQIIRWRVSQSEKLKSITPSAIISKQCESLLEQQKSLHNQRHESENNLDGINERYDYCNNQFAQYALGKLYLMGHDVKIDKETALKWLTASAAQGNVYAQFLIDHIDSFRDPSVLLVATRLMRDLGGIFREDQYKNARGQFAHIDHKRMRQLREKKMAQGHAYNDYEPQSFLEFH